MQVRLRLQREPPRAGRASPTWGPSRQAPQQPRELEEAQRLNDRLIQRALALGGTSTGEHGVGLGKLPYMEPEHGAGAVAAMRAIKTALDPHDIMNPGKIIPVDGSPDGNA